MKKTFLMQHSWEQEDEQPKKKRRNFSKYYEKKKKVGQIKIGKWMIEEEKIFLEYVKNHRECFETNFIRKSTKVFKSISVLLKTRSPMQCRSHYQKIKLYSRYQTVQSIIEYMECKISNGKMVLLKLPSQEVEEKEKECKVKKEEHTEESDEKLIVKQEQDIHSGNEIKISISLRRLSTIW